MYGFLEACFGLKYRLGEPLSLEPWKRIGPTLFLCRNTPDLYDKPIPFLYLCPPKENNKHGTIQ